MASRVATVGGNLSIKVSYRQDEEIMGGLLGRSNINQTNEADFWKICGVFATMIMGRLHSRPSPTQVGQGGFVQLQSSAFVRPYNSLFLLFILSRFL